MATAKEIKSYLDKYIQGQEEAKRRAAVMVYNHMRGIKENVLFIGPSGSGKTEIFRALQAIFPRQIVIYDISNITQDGWSGSKKYNSVFKTLLQTGYSKREIENMLIVFDEFDKITEPCHTSQGDNVHDQVQSELLSMIEGSDVPLDKDGGCIDTRGISFAFCGAFNPLYTKRRAAAESRTIGFSEAVKEERKPITIEDLMNEGLKPELAGRISGIAVLDALDRNQVRELLRHPMMSPFSKMASKYNCSIYATNELIDELIEMSQDNRRGVRAIASYIQDQIDKEIYEPGSSGLLSIIEKEESAAPNEELQAELAEEANYLDQ